MSNVQVMCFWGGEVLAVPPDDFRYSEGPKQVILMDRNMSFDELNQQILKVLGKDPCQCNLKLSCRFPTGQSKFYRLEICNDKDVDIMLGIPERSYNNIWAVELFVDIENVWPSFVGSDYFPVGVGHFTNLLTQPTPSNSFQSHHMNIDGNFAIGASDFNSEYFSMENAVEVDTEVDVRLNSRCEDMIVGEPHNVKDRDPRLFSNSVFEMSMRDDIGDADNGSRMPPSEDENSCEDDRDEAIDSVEDIVGCVKENVGDVEMPALEHVPTAAWFVSDVLNNECVQEGYAESSFNISNGNLFVGALFANKEVLKSVVEEIHIKQRRHIHTSRSRDVIYEVKCIDDNCKWRLRAAKLKKHGMFEITRLPYEHTCQFMNPTQDHRNISAKLISNIIISMVADNPDIKVGFIQGLIRKDYQYHVTYKRAWYGKQAAIAYVFGDWITSYAMLPKFMAAVMHYNPGTIVKIETSNPVFEGGPLVCKRVWWCFKPIIDGWQHARPVMTIDATFLKGRYKGKLLVAMGFDTNMQQYPVAYALVDEETTDNWSWFLGLLRNHVARRRSVCLISDRAQGIIQAMKLPESGFTPPYGFHHFCLHHVRSNFASANPGSQLKLLCWLAGNTPQKRKFEAYMEEIEKISPPASVWLRKMSPEMWTLSYDGGCRYGQMTTNLVECFNNNVKKARFLPITAMVEYIFYRTVKLFNQRRVDAKKALSDGHEYCKRSLKMFEKIMMKATAHEVCSYNIDAGIFDVKTARYMSNKQWKGGNIQVVKLNEFSCSCGKWTAYGCPCSHVVASCMKIKKNYEQFVSQHHRNEQYEKMWEPNFQPLMHKDYWTFPLPLELENLGDLVPDENLKKTKKKPGDKGGTARIHTEMDNSKKVFHCRTCGQEGHTRRSKKCPQRPP